MQHSHTRENIVLAGLGRRFAATFVDMIVVFFILVLALLAAAAAGALDIAQYSKITWPPKEQFPGWVYVLAYGTVFVYYTLFELRSGTTPGKRAFRLVVTMDDGSAPRAGAIVARNLVRIPELVFYYIPSAISCLASPRNKRLGDIVARTVVVQTGAAASVAAMGRGFATAHGAPPRAASATAPMVASPAATAPETPEPEIAPAAAAEAAVAALKTAALAVQGAHLNYLRFSEAELAKAAASATVETAVQPPQAAPLPAETAGAPAAKAAEEALGQTLGEPAGEPLYSPEYTAAWYTLTDAVMALQKARAQADAAATRARTTLPAECAGHPDLVHLFRELEPYFTAGSDEQVHEAFMRVARGETS